MEFQYLININWGYPLVNHGGDDPGAVGNDIIEKDYTLKISEYIYDRLSDMGIDAAMTRTRDTTLDPDTRTEIVQSFYGDGADVIVLSNHINAGGQTLTLRRV